MTTNQSLNFLQLGEGPAGHKGNDIQYPPGDYEWGRVSKHGVSSCLSVKHCGYSKGASINDCCAKAYERVRDYLPQECVALTFVVKKTSCQVWLHDKVGKVRFPVTPTCDEAVKMRYTRLYLRVDLISIDEPECKDACTQTDALIVWASAPTSNGIVKVHNPLPLADYM